jgi:hypothetical protein
VRALLEPPRFAALRTVASSEEWSDYPASATAVARALTSHPRWPLRATRSSGLFPTRALPVTPKTRSGNAGRCGIRKKRAIRRFNCRQIRRRGFSGLHWRSAFWQLPSNCQAIATANATAIAAAIAGTGSMKWWSREESNGTSFPSGMSASKPRRGWPIPPSIPPTPVSVCLPAGSEPLSFA